MMPSLSIVSTIYKSNKTIKEFCIRASNEAKKHTDDYEIILIDDGSPDNSVQILNELKSEIPEIIILQFTRNYGHHNALLAGTLAATKDLVFILDSDLEEKPEDFSNLYNEMNNKRVEIVLSKQYSRKGNFIEAKIGGLFYKLFDFFTDKHILLPKDVLTSRLITKNVVESLKNYPEYSVFYGGIMADTGHSYTIIDLEKTFKGTTSYHFWKRLSLLFNAFSDFSFAPLKLIIISGITLFLFSFLFFAYVLLKQMFTTSLQFNGYLSLMLLSLFIFSFQLISTGILGYYIWKILLEVKQRPRWIFKKENNGLR